MSEAALFVVRSSNQGSCRSVPEKIEGLSDRMDLGTTLAPQTVTATIQLTQLS